MPRKDAFYNTKPTLEPLLRFPSTVTVAVSYKLQKNIYYDETAINQYIAKSIWAWPFYISYSYANFLRLDSVRDLSVDIRFPPEEKNQQAGFKKAGSRADV